VLAGWSVLAPLYHAADEPNHADAVMRLEEGRGWPSTRTARVTDEGIGATAASPYGRAANRLTLNLAPIPESLAPGRHDRPEWQNLRALPGTSGKIIQQSTQHPPGYYWYEALILRAGGAAGWRWDIAVSTMRLLSALLVVWLPLLAWATAWRVTGNRLAGIAAAVVPLAVPELSHVGSSVNNDNLVTLAGAAALVGIACALCGDRSRATAVWTGLWIAVGLWAKAFALVLVPLVIIVYAIPWLSDRWRQRRARKAANGPPLPGSGWRGWLPDRRTGVLMGYGAGMAVVLGGWWYVINEARYGAVQPPVPNFPLGKYLGHDSVAFLKYLTQGVLVRWWGSLGWYEVNLPWRLIVLATIVVAGVAIVGFVRYSGRRLALLLLLWPTVTSYVLVAAQAISHYLSTHYVSGLSGRYLFIGFTGVAAVVGAGCSALPRKLARWSPLILLMAAGAMQAEAAHLAINRWWRPVGGALHQAWSALSAWSTWPVGVLFTGVALLILAALSTFVALAVTGARNQATIAPPHRADSGPVILTDEAELAAGEQAEHNNANHTNAGHANAGDPSANDPVGR
jgi:small subunit ribosomal protein S36